MRHPVLSQPGARREPDPRVERPRHRDDCWRRSSACTRRTTFPSHRPALPGTSRPVRPRINETRSTIKQVEVGIVDRGWDETSSPRCARPSRPASASRSSAPAPPAGRAHSSRAPPPGHRVRARRTGSVGFLRTASRSSRWRSASWTGGWSRCAPRAHSSGERERRRQHLRGRAAGGRRCDRARGGATAWRDLRSPDGNSPGSYQAMEFLRGHRVQQATSTSTVSAAGKHS